MCVCVCVCVCVPCITVGSLAQVPDMDAAIRSVHIDSDGAYMAAVNNKVCDVLTADKMAT